MADATKGRKRQRKPAMGDKRVRRKANPEGDGASNVPESTSLKRKGAISYAGEVRDMMYTFGDARNSNEETVALVESIVLSYLSDLVNSRQTDILLRKINIYLILSAA